MGTRRGAWHAETTGVTRILQAAKQRNDNVREVIHDDNVRVDKVIQEHTLDSQKDCWQNGKGISRKFDEQVGDVKRTKFVSVSECTNPTDLTDINVET